jgi:lipoprotein-anchoring transpeptidase ErfK/SrfK
VQTKSLILVTACVAVLVVLGGALYAYDHARANEIAPGVQVAGISVGGMSVDQARARLEREIMRPLERPIVIHHANKTWTLGAREARIRADLSAMVDQALAKSRSGDLFTRSWRSLTGDKLNADLRPSVQFSDAAVIRLIDHVRKSVERPAKDASVKLSGAGLSSIPGSDGLAIQASALHRQINAAITSPTAKRTFVATTHHTQPKVTTDALARKYQTVIIVNRGQFRLRLFKGLKLHETYPIAVGQVGLETPAGLYHIQNKAVNPAWNVPDRDWAGDLAGTVVPGGSPENPLKARWLGIFAGAGIHGTDAESSIGTAASHGCVRMRIPDVKELYDQVPVGAPIYIA